MEVTGPAVSHRILFQDKGSRLEVRSVSCVIDLSVCFVPLPALLQGWTEWLGRD